VILFPSRYSSLRGTGSVRESDGRRLSALSFARIHAGPAVASVVAALAAATCSAQQAQPIALVPTDGVTISGGLNVINGQASIVNSGSVTAGERTARLSLTRGGELRLCSTTTLSLSKDSTNVDPHSTALMMTLEKGAVEASYTAGRFSDVLLTPDLRVFISGPGLVDLRIRVNAQGDTCVENHGALAPYVTVSSLLEGGLYRVQANQRVLFEHGSLHDVVDHESEPCGCPPPPIISVASTGTSGGKTAKPGQTIGGPSSTPSDTEFPLAQSEGLAPAPKPAEPATKPVTQAAINVPLVYNGEAPPPTAATPIPPYNPDDPVAVTPPPAPPKPATNTKPAATTPQAPRPAAPRPAPAATTEVATATAQQVQPKPSTARAQSPNRGVFHRIGHFFAKIFGG
jgi:hypothetical protein